MHTIKTLFPQATGNQVFGLSAEQIRVALTQLAGPGNLALIHLTYPSVDNLNHKSRDNLVSRLSGHGFAETAELVANEQAYLAFEDLPKALKVYHEIQQDSMAVGAALYYNGKTGMDAVEAIHSIKVQKEAGLHLVSGGR